MTLQYSDYSCLEAVDELISKAQRQYDDLLWSAAGMTYGDSEGSLDDNTTTLSSILNQLDYLYSLQEQGIVYEPNF